MCVSDVAIPCQVCVVKTCSENKYASLCIARENSANYIYSFCADMSLKGRFFVSFVLTFFDVCRHTMFVSSDSSRKGKLR